MSEYFQAVRLTAEGYGTTQGGNPPVAAPVSIPIIYYYVPSDIKTNKTNPGLLSIRVSQQHSRVYTSISLPFLRLRLQMITVRHIWLAATMRLLSCGNQVAVGKRRSRVTNFPGEPWNFGGSNDQKTGGENIGGNGTMRSLRWGEIAAKYSHIMPHHFWSLQGPQCWFMLVCFYFFRSWQTTNFSKDVNHSFK